MCDNLSKPMLEQMVRQICENKKEVASKEYMDWLYEFTKVNPKFTDDTWLYRHEEISSEDYDNVMKLAYFYELISEYCHKNIINSYSKESREECYNIKYKDKYFCIGVIVGQGAFAFVEALDKQPEKFIEYDNIINDIQDEAYPLKKEKLFKMEELLIELKSLEVSYEVSLSIVRKVYWN